MPGPTPIQKRNLFEGHALFGRLPPADLDALLLRARTEHYPAGRVIFAKGSPGRSMMALLKGSVRISAPTPAGPDIVLTMLQVGEVMFGRLDARIAKALLRLAHGAPAARDGVTLRITQQELAGMVGATRESVNKQLHVWQGAGMVQLGKRLILIPDIDAIETLA